MSTLTLNQPKLNWNARLTDHESAIDEQVILGNTREEVAEMFHLSVFAVIEVIRRSFRKTGARNISELATWMWCAKILKQLDEKIDVTMIISEGKRKIVTLGMIILILITEFAGQSELRSRRSRRSKDEYECLADVIDFTIPEYITI